MSKSNEYYTAKKESEQALIAWQKEVDSQVKRSVKKPEKKK